MSPQIIGKDLGGLVSDHLLIMRVFAPWSWPHSGRAIGHRTHYGMTDGDSRNSLGSSNISEATYICSPQFWLPQIWYQGFERTAPPLMALGKNPSSPRTGFRGLSANLGQPRFAAASALLCLCLYMACSPCLSLNIPLFSLIMAPIVGLRAHPSLVWPHLK